MILVKDIAAKKTIRITQHSDKPSVKNADENCSVKEALDFVVPSWPLQHTVAVSPFWNLKNRDFYSVAEDLASIIHHSLYMDLDYYLDKYQSGAITDRALSAALDAARLRFNSVPEHPDELVQLSKIDRDISRRYLGFVEFFDRQKGTNWQDIVLRQVSQYAAAYFDQGQAVAPFPWKHHSFWQAWKSAQEADGTMAAYGIKQFKSYLKIPEDLDAEEYVRMTVENLQLPSSVVETRYLRRLFARAFGWSTQFQFCEWQRNLGYKDVPKARLVEFLAVLLAYDNTLAKIAIEQDPTLLDQWVQSISDHLTDDASRVHSFELHQIWQSALELTYQTNLAGQIQKAPSTTANEKASFPFQIAMCIDVRSEVVRRALEASSPQVRTIGFAGFFGMPFVYRPLDEKLAAPRLPVLLPPAFEVAEKTSHSEPVLRKVMTQSFFRNLRKAPLSSFAYVEIFGIYSLAKMFKETWSSIGQKSHAPKTPQRFDDAHRGPDLKSLSNPQGARLDPAVKLERAQVILQHMGLLKTLKVAPPRLLVVTGHGSSHRNNAFRSSLDCGACGGHAGDINARVVADLLNDPEVRKGLEQKGTPIPSDTWVLAALHETVTDEIYPLDEDRVPHSHVEDLKKIKALFATAGQSARKEREAARSPHLDPSAARRASNWSETRPEWGLAGNAAFIVAPRSMTKGINLAGRTFLHDYDAALDENFATLELIMTAPMLVTNWINLQYYASTVAPQVYGSGNKLLHNLVNESGVFEGNGGDLRFGLPLQSVHDGEKFIHEPLRLSVLIAAPRSALENIISRHETVRHLIDHGWLHFFHIDQQTKQIFRRRPGGLYIPVEALEAVS